MNWFAKKVFDRGGKHLKNPNNSTCYLSNSLKNLKYFADKFLEKIRNLNKKLTFAAYDRIGGAGSRAQEDSGAGILRNISAFIKKIVSDAQSKPLNRRTEKISNATLRCPCAGGAGNASWTAEFQEVLQSNSMRTEPVMSIVRKLRLRAANCGSILISKGIIPRRLGRIIER